MSDLTELIPPAEREILKATFQQQREVLPNMTPEQFIGNILWRVYTELCCSFSGCNVRSPYPHAGDAFRQWVDQEVHYILEGKPIDDAKYTEVHQSILRAVAARAVELFTAWKGKTCPADQNDKRNLRGSLHSYLPKHLRNPSRKPSDGSEPEQMQDVPPRVEQKPDGTSELSWFDPKDPTMTMVIARGTPDRPLPEWLVKNPREAAELFFALLDCPLPDAPAEGTGEEPMLTMPENATYAEISVPDARVGQELGMKIMMETGSIIMRKGNKVVLSVTREKFPAVWEICRRYGIAASMISFR